MMPAISKEKYDPMMRDNKHYLAVKINGFWNFFEKHPPEGYIGTHRRPAHEMIIGGHVKGQLWLGCQTCLMYLTDGRGFPSPKRLVRTRHWNESSL